MTEASTEFPGLIETLPGNLASFARELEHSDEGARLTIEAVAGDPALPVGSLRIRALLRHAL
jgi:hypothetical protein